MGQRRKKRGASACDGARVSQEAREAGEQARRVQRGMRAFG